MTQFATDELFNRLIVHKWEHFGRALHLRRTVLPYCAILALFTCAALLRAAEIGADWAARVPNATLVPGGPPACTAGFEVGVLEAVRGGDSLRAATLGLQAVLAVLVAPVLLWMGLGQRRLETRDLDLNHDGCGLASSLPCLGAPPPCLGLERLKPSPSRLRARAGGFRRRR